MSSCCDCNAAILLEEVPKVKGYYRCPYDKKIHTGSSDCKIDDRFMSKKAAHR